MEKARILVVEDEAIVAMDIANTLRNLGHEVTDTVPSGKQAITSVKENRPDVILMDIGLKGEMDGIQTAEQIRSQYSIPVIFLTAYADEKTLERAKITAPCGYLTKPFEETDLRIAIEVGLYRAKLESEREALIKELQEARDKYLDLYDFAPTGYFTLDRNSLIVDVNLAGRQLLGSEKHRLIGAQFTASISADSQDAFYFHYREVLKTGIKGNCELKMLKADGTPFHAQLISMAVPEKDGNLNHCRTAIIDMTERKQAEETLRESEENFRNSLDNSPLGIRIITAEGELLYVNQAILDIYSYGSFEELKSTPTKQRYTPESYVEHRRRAEDRKLDKPVPDNYEIGIIRKDGEVKYLQVFRRELTWNGKTQFQSIYQDITERKWAEETLRASEKKYSQLVERGNDGIILIHDGRLVFSNSKIREMTGFSQEEYIDKPFVDFITPQYRDKLAERYKKRISGEKVPNRYEIEILTKDGEMIPVEVNASIVEYEGKLSDMAIVRDISERKKAESEVRIAHAELEQIFETAADAMRVIDKDFYVLRMNKRYETLSGISRDEAVGKKCYEVLTGNLCHTPDCLLTRILNGEEFIEQEGEKVRSDGTRIPCIASATPFREPDGKLLGIVENTRDITERKQAEEERQKMAKLESVGTLAGGIAHDFNNLLTGIMGNISLAKRYVEPKSKAEERLLEAEKASERARDLTQQLLTFSRGGAPVKNLVSIAGLIKESAGFALRGSNIRCDFDLPEDLWPVAIDEGQINQVIANLVINAQEAMPEGGTININAMNTVVQGRSTLPLSKGRYVKIDIIDQGVGIKKKHLDRIFDPYFTTKQKGSGLGLATTYSIIKNHGGYITVESALGIGTTFHICLPASKKSVAVEKEAKAEVVTTGEGRILVMDDEEMIREMLGNILRLAGYKATLTGDGAEAIEQYTKAKESGQPFDAVIMDLTIPGGMGGKKAITKLLEIDPDAKVIVSSGYATDPIMSDYKKYGFSAVVTKPYSVAQIEKTLQSLLRKKK